MTEIKFRVWDEYHRKMIYENDIQCGPSEYANCKLLWMSEDGDLIKLMQYMWLKDKNGRDIYEGDIIKCIDEYDYECDSCYSSYHYKREHKEIIDIGNYYWACFMDPENIEVLGNICENPGLEEDK